MQNQGAGGEGTAAPPAVALSTNGEATRPAESPTLVTGTGASTGTPTPTGVEETAAEESQPQQEGQQQQAQESPPPPPNDQQEIDLGGGRKATLAELKKAYARYPKLRESFDRRSQELNQARRYADLFQRIWPFIQQNPELAQRLLQQVQMAGGMPPPAQGAGQLPQGQHQHQQPFDEARVAQMLDARLQERLGAMGFDETTIAQTQASRTIETWEATHGIQLNDDEFARIANSAADKLEDAQESGLDELPTVSEAVQEALVEYVSSQYAKGRGAGGAPTGAATGIAAPNPQIRGKTGGGALEKPKGQKPNPNSPEFLEMVRNVAYKAAGVPRR